jgi:thiol-disulfide isomerase/thioredoxin
MILNGFVYAAKSLKFVNPGNRDTLITRKININRLTLLYYQEVQVDNGKVNYQIESILLVPGDNVTIDNQTKNIVAQKGINNFIDRIISIPKECYPIMPPSQSGGTDERYRTISNLFESNKKSIEQSSLQPDYKEALNIVNLLIKYQLLCRIPFQGLSGERLQEREILNSNFLKDSKVINSLNVSIKQELFYQILCFDIYIKDKAAKFNDIWSIFDKVSPEIKKTEFYRDYLVSNVISAFNFYPGKLKDIQVKVTQVHSVNPVLDTLKPLLINLLLVRDDVKKAKENLLRFNGGKYSFILNDEMEAKYEHKSIKDLSNTFMYDIVGKKMSMQDAFKDQTTKLYLIDVWAQWCIPCIKEAKALNGMNSYLKGKSIRIISVSIDKESDRTLWKSRILDLKGRNDSDQYLLVDGDNSPFRTFFRIETIPRFILVDKTGKIVDDDFCKPSSPDFRSKLESNL